MQIKIKKSSGDLEAFSSRKLKDSLKNCELTNNEINFILSQVTPKLYAVSYTHLTLPTTPYV